MAVAEVKKLSDKELKEKKAAAAAGTEVGLKQSAKA